MSTLCFKKWPSHPALSRQLLSLTEFVMLGPCWQRTSTTVSMLGLAFSSIPDLKSGLFNFNIKFKEI